jgi:hypothetical protein
MDTYVIFIQLYFNITEKHFKLVRRGFLLLMLTKNRDKKRIDGCFVMYNNETTAALIRLIEQINIFR